MTTDIALPTDSVELTTIPANSSSADVINVTKTTPVSNATNHDETTSEMSPNVTANPTLTTSSENTGQTDNIQQTGPPLVAIILGVLGGVLIVGISVTVWIWKRRNGKDIFRDLIPLVDKKPDTDSGFEDFPYYGEVLSSREAEPVFGQLQVGGHDVT
ncbi:Hypp1263 [Branchiostoma lanceolatum]|uniref:Hypp1263 protein n=1 Tax=Branchiostoma lanceolatum TaxID=7740 RepID=A0A8K0EMQ3_BRALA|nr:Hypp1263 [Branchiostoma lanceolatum]